VAGRDAEAEDVANLGVDGVVVLGLLALGGACSARDDGLDAAADESGDLRAAVGAGCCLRDLLFHIGAVQTCVSGSRPLISC